MPVKAASCDFLWLSGGFDKKLRWKQFIVRGRMLDLKHKVLCAWHADAVMEKLSAGVENWKDDECAYPHGRYYQILKSKWER